MPGLGVWIDPAQAALQPTRRLPGQEGWGHPGCETVHISLGQGPRVPGQSGEQRRAEGNATSGGCRPLSPCHDPRRGLADYLATSVLRKPRGKGPWLQRPFPVRLWLGLAPLSPTSYQDVRLCECDHFLPRGFLGVREHHSFPEVPVGART